MMQYVKENVIPQEAYGNIYADTVSSFIVATSPLYKY
jgi:hypothetical protein